MKRRKNLRFDEFCLVKIYRDVFGWDVSPQLVRRVMRKAYEDDKPLRYACKSKHLARYSKRKRIRNLYINENIVEVAHYVAEELYGEHNSFDYCVPLWRYFGLKGWRLLCT